MSQLEGGLDSLLEELSSFTTASRVPSSVDLVEVTPVTCLPKEGGGSAGELVELPVEYMLHVGQNLPDLTSELHSAQLYQELEVERREEELRVLLDQLKQEKERLQSVQKQLCATNKAICLTQDEEAQRREECDKLKKSLSDLVDKKHRLKGELKRVDEKTEQDSKLFENYRTKMNRHRQRTEEVEKNTPPQLELKAMRDKVEELHKQRKESMKRDWLKEVEGLREELVVMETDHMKVNQESSDVGKLIEQRKEDIKKLKREMEINKKRRAAQLIRLQRQVSEAQSRRRQFIEESQRLKTAIRDMKKIIEE